MKKLLLAVAILLVTQLSFAQWTAQTSNIAVNHYAQFISAVDNDVCWGLMSDQFSQLTPVQEYVKTVDGGATWIPGFINNAAGLAPSGIFGLNADTGWVALFNPSGGAGKILRTDDGGANWVHQSTALFNAAGNFPNWIFFWDENNGVCHGDPTAGYMEIYTTTDGGVNWVRTPDSLITPELPGEFGITDVFRQQGDSSLYFGTNLGRIYKTADRGLSWTVAQTPFGDFIGAIAFRDANNGLCTSGGATGSVDVARTTDGGATWSLVGTNTAGMTLKLGMCYVPNTPALYFISTPAAGSVDGTTYSPNDGNTWVPVDNLIHSDIEFVNDSIGWTGSNELNAPMFKWSTPFTFAIDDAASQSIDMATNVGINTFSPQATFLNNGQNTVTFDVTMTITGGYSSTKNISNLAFFATQQVTFDPWTPAAPGSYTVTVYTSLVGDTDNSNDTLTLNITVYPEFENYGWVSKPNITAGSFGLAGAFNLLGNSSSSPGTLYSLGGATFAAVQSTMFGFNTALNNWSAAPPMATPKYQFSAQKVGNKIYAAGGYSGGFTPDMNVYVYDITNNIWNNGAFMPAPVGDYASGVYKDSLIYFIGGYNGTGDDNGVKIYNTYTNSWTTGTAKPGTAVAGLRGGIYNDKIVVAGGYSQILGTQIDEAWIGTINPVTPNVITWAPLPPYPGGPRGRLAGGIAFRGLRPLVYFVGGDPTGLGVETRADCWGYNLLSNQWEIGAEKITAMSNISDFVGLVYNDSLWLASVSGYDGTILSTVNEWLNLGASPPLGIEENNLVENDLLTLYPNPSSGELNIVLKENSEAENIFITDITGRIVIAEPINPAHSVLHLNIKNLDAGIYFLSISDKNGTRGNIKFIKE